MRRGEFLILQFHHLNSSPQLHIFLNHYNNSPISNRRMIPTAKPSPRKRLVRAWETGWCQQLSIPHQWSCPRNGHQLRAAAGVSTTGSRTPQLELVMFLLTAATTDNPVLLVLMMQAATHSLGNLSSETELDSNGHSAAAARSLQSHLTLCDPKDGSPPGSLIPGILQAGTLEWVAISFSNMWKWEVKVKSLSHVRLLAIP